MCYVVFFSTTCDEDFSNRGDGLFILEKVGNDESEECAKLLQYPNRWYLMSKFGGCSCHYRHASRMTTEMFGPPEDWCPEDPENVESTAAFYDLIAPIVRAGYKLDIVDAWSGTPNEEILSLPVSLTDVPRDCFRFIVDRRLDVIA